MPTYLRPGTLDDALAALAAQRLTVLAGGTDFYPARVGRPLDDDVLDITALGELHGIRDEGTAWRIGALTTWSDLLRAELPPCFDGLKAAAREVGGVQVQNAGTLIGNLCNASPAADGVPNLLALDAEVELASAAGERRLPLADFVVGNRETQCRPQELVTGVLLPKPRPGASSAFVKLGARRYLVISIVMLAVVIEPEAGRVAGARVAVGACSPVAQRLPALEAALRDRALDSALGDALSPDHLRAVLAPIDDVRASADYRWDAAETALRRCLSELGESLGGAA
ncbi:MAG: FAD binding domain-containing protein [Kiloniellales bacterium]|nr:FAD binding domain-containing protein [Kiloniellales bacterium]